MSKPPEKANTRSRRRTNRLTFTLVKSVFDILLIMRSCSALKSGLCDKEAPLMDQTDFCFGPCVGRVSTADTMLLGGSIAASSSRCWNIERASTFVLLPPAQGAAASSFCFLSVPVRRRPRFFEVGCRGKSITFM